MSPRRKKPPWYLADSKGLMGTDNILYPYLFNMFPSSADIYKLYRSVTDAKHSTDGRVGQVCFSKQTLDFTHLVRLQFSLTIAFSLIISSLLFAPMQVFFASTPMEIISTIIGAIIVYMVYVSLFGQRFAVESPTNQLMDSVMLWLAILYKSYKFIPIFIGLRLNALIGYWMTWSSDYTLNTTKIRHNVARILYTRFPNFSYTFISQDNFTSYVKLLRLGLSDWSKNLAT